MRIASRKWLLLLLVLVAGLGASAQVKPIAPRFVPACDLLKLNQEYVAQLNRLRQQLYPHAPLVHFDPGLLVGTVLHTVRMQNADSLFHDYDSRPFQAAELVGTKRTIQTQEARTIAQFALSQFESSELHCAIQEQPNLVYVAISASQDFYAVRLAQVPLVAERKEQEAFAKLKIKLAATTK